MELKELIIKLSDADGVTGLDEALNIAEKELSPLGKVTRDNMGGLAAEIKGKKDYTLLLDAHIDEIGMMITAIEDGFVRVAKCGGIDVRTLISQEVVIHGKENIFGVFCSIPPHLKGESKNFPDIDEMGIDIGLSKDDAEKIISIGDRVSFRQKAVSLIGDRISGKSLDNRAGCAAVIRAAEILCDDGDAPCNIVVSLSAQEELGLRGARTATYNYFPDEAIVVDVSFGAFQGIPSQKTGKLTKGPMICISPITDRFMTGSLIDICENEKIPYQREVCGSSTGTNADIISVTKSGVKTALISIPLLNMHTAAETISLDDVENTAQLIAEYVRKAVK